MAETYNRLELDVNVKPYDIITAVQKDSDSRYLDVFLFNNGVPVDLTGHEVRIYMRKPENGGEIFNDGEITEPENGRCQFLLTTAALEKVGHLQTQISIWKDNKEILSTQIFEINVTESLRTTGSIEGSNEYGALVVLFQNLYESMDLMTDMVQNFGTAGEVAAGIPAGTFWQMLEAVYAVNKDALENASVSEVLKRIGLMGDTGGSLTAGTLMAKENEIMKMVSKINDKSIWGKWVTLTSRSLYFSLAPGKQETKTIITPAKAWFSYIFVYEGSPIGNDRSIELMVTINGTTYRMSAAIINGRQYQVHYMFTYAGLQAIYNVIRNENIQNSNFPLVPIFPYFEEEMEITVVALNKDTSETRNASFYFYCLTEEKPQ